MKKSAKMTGYNELKAEEKTMTHKELEERNGTMTHEQMMNRAWEFIREVGITEDKAEFQKDPDNVILVDDIYKVRDAYYSDLENGVNDEDEDIYGFLDRHGIEWQ